MVFHRQIFNSKLRVSNGDKSRAAIVSPLSKYRNAGAPAIDFLHAALEGAPVFTSGIELANEFDELTPYKGEGIVTKQFPGSFTQTDLQGILKAACRTKVVLTGYMAYVCASTTAGQAAEKGWHIIIAKDAVGTETFPV